MARTSFFADIYDSSGNKIAALVTLMSLTTTDRLNGIGEAIFMLPGNDPATQHIVTGAEFQIFDEVDGDLGRFLYRTSSIQDSDAQAIVTVACWSVMQELVRQITGFAREYDNEPVEDIVEDLVTSVAGWTADTDIGMGNAAVTYQGQSILDAISELANRWYYSFRMGAGIRELEFRTLGAVNNNVRLVAARGQSAAVVLHTEVAFIGSITETTEYDGIVNRVIALGAGEGAGQLTLENQNASRHDYVVDSITPSNGQEYWYIEDSDSITAYGLREVPIIFEDIKPIANTLTAKTRAANELMFAAEAYILRHKDPRVQYDIGDIRGLRAAVQVGDKITVDYRGVDAGFKYIEVLGDFWLMEMTKDRDAGSGDRITRMVLTNVDKRRTDDIQMWKQLTKRIRSQKLLINPSAFRISDTYIETIQHGNGLYADKNADFTLTFDDTVTDVTRVILEWRTKPLFTMSAGSPVNDTAINFPSGDPHTHLVTDFDNFFQVMTSANYPTDVSIYLNNVDISDDPNIDYIEGGNGIWNNGGTPNAALFVRMDITDLILGDAGGIYQTFAISVRVGVARTRDVATPHYTTTSPLNNATGNHGIVEMKVITQGIAQAIYRL